MLLVRAKGNPRFKKRGRGLRKARHLSLVSQVSATKSSTTIKYLVNLFIEMPCGGAGTHSNYNSVGNLKIKFHTARKSQSLIEVCHNCRISATKSSTKELNIWSSTSAPS